MKRACCGLVVGCLLVASSLALAQVEAVDLFRLGAQELAAGQIDQAIDAFQKGVQVKPEAREGWYNLGVAYGRKRLHQKEAEAYQKALELDPKYVNAWHNLGLAWYDLGQKDKAIEALTKAAQLDESAQDAWNNLGVVMLDKGDPAAAATAFRKAAAVSPACSECRFNLGVALLRQADQETVAQKREPLLREAVKANDEVLALDAKNHRAAFNKGIVLHRLGDVDGEIAACRVAIGIKPDYLAALYNLATALSQKADRAAALEAWEIYAKAASGNPAERPFVDNANKEIVRLKTP